MSAVRGARYARMFERLAAARQGAFVPFVMLGDPDPQQSLAVVRTLAAAGADALELGLPFSDPIADGPVIQAAAARALRAGVQREDCWNILRTVRAEFPELPIGLLVYANLICHREPAEFYDAAVLTGVDSVLVADLPIAEAAPIAAIAKARGIAPVFIAPPNADDSRLRAIAGAGEAYTYVTSREGVTGADERLRRDPSALLARLRALGAAPPLLGFGISNPAQVRAAMTMGAAGVICGSAIVARVADGRDLTEFVQELKRAT
jgi:tryptophan synthase alpha chain